MTDHKIKRFSTYRIAEHWIYMATFIVLVVTGLSQKFHSLDISLWLIFHLGGIDYVRLIHRYAGMVFLVVTALHIITGIVCIAAKKWPPSMVINKKDFSDAIHNIRYYLGVETQPAICDRYSYKQKFEYWGVIISAVLMIMTGIILWLPAFLTRFLPGEIIPAAKVMHTNQGFLMFLIIALWHIYNSIFSPEIFPIDKSIFTGSISRDRMLREHPVELARMEGRPIDAMIDAMIDESLEVNEHLS
ncbi:MAG: formate dehydrogenase subunit gamma [Nitrospirota bacterium]